MVIMRSNAIGRLIAILSVMAIIVAGISANVLADNENSIRNCEEQGLEFNNAGQASDILISPGDKTPSTSSILEERVLLIPNSTDDSVGMYDPVDGTFLGFFITYYAGFGTPICAIKGPDGNIYVSDQTADAVFVFDTTGTYISTYADASDGLNNIRGIDFRGDRLYVTSGDDYVAEFSGPHNRVGDFINDGSDSFDIYFLDDGRALLADIQGSSDNVRLYNVDGTFSGVVINVDFPEQIQMDLEEPGAFLNASFSDNQITDFDLDGTIHETTPLTYGRGVYRLENGNLLATNSTGVFEIDPGSGSIIEQQSSGSARFIELYVSGEQVGIDEDSPETPNRHALSNSYPNPFNAVTSIQYDLPRACGVTIDIYDLLGNKVERLLEAEQNAGHHQVAWNAGMLPTGVYFYKIRAGNIVETNKMLLLK